MRPFNRYVSYFIFVLSLTEHMPKMQMSGYLNVKKHCLENNQLNLKTKSYSNYWHSVLHVVERYCFLCLEFYAYVFGLHE